jgi:DNA-binding protein H-NS
LRADFFFSGTDSHFTEMVLISKRRLTFFRSLLAMATYLELLKQRDMLAQQIEDARKRETADALTKVRAIVAEYQLTAQEVFPIGRKSRSRSVGKVAPKYRDPATGQTWTGRGKAPRWIDGKDRSQFLIG